MANKITIQHYYTTGSSAPTSLELGEIAIAHSGGSEAIYIKNGVKFIPESQIDKKFEDAGIASNGVITGLSKQLTDHITNSGTTSNVGHVKLASGDLSSKNGVIDGEAAASYHTHGQYLTEITVDSGQLIASLIENGVVNIELTTGITRQINSGVSGYNRIEAHEPKSGTTADIGHVKLVGGDLSGKTGNTVNGEAAASHHTHGQYAKNNDLTSHTINTDIHVNTIDKATWNGAAAKLNASASTWNTAAESINTFMNSENIEGAVDTLKEIQKFLDGTGSTVQMLLEDLSGLTESVNNNSIEISSLKAEKVTSVAISGDNLNAILNQYEDDKQYIITHSTAGDIATELTATNTATGLSFGSGFTIVDNIGYDANGHVVSGSTQTLKLPTIAPIDGLSGTTAKNEYNENVFTIGHSNKFFTTTTGITEHVLNFGDSIEIPILNFVNNEGRDPMLMGIDSNGHLKTNGWTLTTFSLPNTISCGTY